MKAKHVVVRWISEINTGCLNAWARSEGHSPDLRPADGSSADRKYSVYWGEIIRRKTSIASSRVNKWMAMMEVDELDLR